MTLALALLGTVALLAALWPFGPYQLSLMAARRLWRFRPVPVASGPAPKSFAICVCAYNERASIEAKIHDLLALREAAGGSLDILVYVDGADDGTAEILEQFSDEIQLFVSEQRRGKTWGMNMLVSRTDAEIIMFTGRQCHDGS